MTRSLLRRSAFRALLCALAICFLTNATGAGQARFRQPNSEYKARRARLRTAIDGPVVLFGYTGREDLSEFAVFYQEPYFYYLTGHDQPGAALVIVPQSPSGPTKGPREILYLPPRDRAEERWEGVKIGPDDPDVTEKTGFEAVEPIAKLPNDLGKLAQEYGERVYTLLPDTDEEGYPHLSNAVAEIRKAAPKADIRDVTPQLAAMRQVKSPGEIELMQRAIDASIDAQLDAMRHMQPGLFEYQVAARMKEVHEMAGCEREAYAPTVGAGFNSTILHYDTLNDEIKDGEVVVIDVGGEYGGYAADITRTLPANGKFTPRQREIYDIVLGAQNAALVAVKPGATMYGGKGSLQEIVMDYFDSHGHDAHGEKLGRYYIHGVSHDLGLDVHDPGDRERPLEPGMVITVEPGLYIPEERLGVRIEDDVLVMKDGYKLLTARLPRTTDEIEEIMAGEKSRIEKSTQNP